MFLFILFKKHHEKGGKDLCKVRLVHRSLSEMFRKDLSNVIFHESEH